MEAFEELSSWHAVVASHFAAGYLAALDHSASGGWCDSEDAGRFLECQKWFVVKFLRHSCMDPVWRGFALFVVVLRSISSILVHLL
jgi:hypothetical protein